jgi:hypothetical protein
VTASILLPVKKLIQKEPAKPACTAQRNFFRDERAAFEGGESDSPVGLRIEGCKRSNLEDRWTSAR